MIAENGTASGCDSLSRAEHNRHKALHHRGAGNADAAVKNQKRVSENFFRSLTLLLSQADAHAGSSTHTGHIRKGRGAHADSGKSHLARPWNPGSEISINDTVQQIKELAEHGGNPPSEGEFPNGGLLQEFFGCGIHFDFPNAGAGG